MARDACNPDMNGPVLVAPLERSFGHSRAHMKFYALRDANRCQDVPAGACERGADPYSQWIEFTCNSPDAPIRQSQHDACQTRWPPDCQRRSGVQNRPASLSPSNARKQGLCVAAARDVLIR